MRPGVPSRPLRPLCVAFVALLLAPVLAGCLGAEEESPRLAQPTDRPIQVPRGTPVDPGTPINFSDPGYVVTGAWRVGDGWDYSSNQSHVMRVRVVDSRFQGGATLFRVETTRLDAKGAVESFTTAWVEARAWGRVNSTDDKGNLDRFSPGAPTRFYKNGTATFNHTRVDPSGKVLLDQSIVLQARLYPVHETILFPWGYLEAKKVDQVTVTRDADGARTQSLVTRWVHKDYLNDVRFQLQSGELYTLTAAKVGDMRRGTLAG